MARSKQQQLPEVEGRASGSRCRYGRTEATLRPLLLLATSIANRRRLAQAVGF